MSQEILDPRQLSVNRTIAILEQRISAFAYNELSSETLDSSSRHRRIKRVEYRSTLGGKLTFSSRDVLDDDTGTYTLALTPNEHVIFILQVRPGLAIPYQVEFPAGTIQPQENPSENVKIELAEEAGVREDSKPIPLGAGAILSGRSSQESHFYLVQQVEMDDTNQNLEHGELILPFTVPAEESLLLAATLMKRRLDSKPPVVGVDPKIITAITLAAQYFYNQGEYSLARKLLNL